MLTGIKAGHCSPCRVSTCCAANCLPPPVAWAPPPRHTEPVKNKTICTQALTADHAGKFAYAVQMQVRARGCKGGAGLRRSLPDADLHGQGSARAEGRTSGGLHALHTLQEMQPWGRQQ